MMDEVFLPGTSFMRRRDRPAGSPSEYENEVYGRVFRHLWNVSEGLQLGDFDGKTDAEFARSLINSGSSLITPPSVSSGPTRTNTRSAEDYFPEPVGGPRWRVQPIRLTWELDGDVELLTHWPTIPGLDLAQLRGPDAPGPVSRYPGDGLGTEWALDGTRLHSWILIVQDTPSGLTLDEQTEFRERQLASWLAAHEEALPLATSTDRLWREAEQFVATRRGDLKFDAQVREELELVPIKPLPIQLEDISSAPFRANIARSEPGSHESPEGVTIPARALSAATFDAFVRSLAQWRRSAEENASRWKGLSEDGYSATVCAALSQRFGDANQDAFVVGARADIRIAAAKLAEVLSEDLPPGESDMLVAEAKIGKQQSIANEAVTQLEGYLGRGCTRGALIFYVTQGADGAEAAVLDALQSHRDIEIDGQRIAGIPIVKLTDPTRPGAQAEVALVVADLEDRGTRADRADARAQALSISGAGEEE